MSFFSHDSACIDKGAVIGDGTKVWHFSHVCSGVQIGKNCTLGQNTFVGSNVIIGNNVKIQNNVSVYEGVILEDNVFCGPSVVFTNVYNPRSFIERKNEYRKTIVREGATLGANSTIRCGAEIGCFSFIGAGSVILENIKDFALIVGNPGRQIGWMSKHGEKLNLPLEGNADVKCPHSGDTYVLKGNHLSIQKKTG